jgi:hypothetical protein
MDEAHVLSELQGANLALYFPIFFVLAWLAVTSLLGFKSGWFVLMKTYPDRSENCMRIFVRQSGSMNGVGMRSLLTLSVCASGLRVGMLRIFGIFCRDFLVPWNAITVSRSNRFLRKVAIISFGQPAIGNLTLSAEVADRIARTAGGLWPEPGPFPVETSSAALSRTLKQWAATTAFAAAFFIVVPRLMAPHTAGKPSIIVAVLFPAIFFGIGGLIQYLRRERA